MTSWLHIIFKGFLDFLLSLLLSALYFYGSKPKIKRKERMTLVTANAISTEFSDENRKKDEQSLIMNGFE